MHLAPLVQPPILPLPPLHHASVRNPTHHNLTCIKHLYRTTVRSVLRVGRYNTHVCFYQVIRV